MLAAVILNSRWHTSNGTGSSPASSQAASSPKMAAASATSS